MRGQQIPCNHTQTAFDAVAVDGKLCGFFGQNKTHPLTAFGLAKVG